MNHVKQLAPDIQKILIVEDDEGLNRLIAKHLHRAGFTCSQVYSGKEALEASVKEEHCLALIDYLLSDMTADLLIEQLQKKQTIAPFIVMTGHGDEQTAVKMMKLGAIDYIIKDHNLLNILPQKIRNACDIIEQKRKLQESQQALEESERRLHTLMDNLPGMAYRCKNHPNWPMEFVSDGAYRLTGYPVTELQGAGGIHYGHIIHPDDRQTVWKQVQSAVKKQSRFELEYRIINKTGETSWVWERGALVKRGNGDAVLEGFITDITDRKKSEEREKHLNTVLRSIRDINQLITYETDTNQLAQKACDILTKNRGYNNVLIILLDDNRQIIRHFESKIRRKTKEFKQYLKSGALLYCIERAMQIDEGVAIIEETMRLCGECPRKGIYRDGSTMAVRMQHDKKTYGILVASVDPQYIDSEEEHALLYEMGCDLAFALHAMETNFKKKEAIKQLQERERQYRLIADNSIDVIWQMDLKLRFTYVSPSIEKLAGYTVKQFLGTKLSEHASTTQFFHMGRKVVHALKNYRTFNYIIFEAMMKHKDGSDIPVEISGNLILNDQGKPEGLQGTTRDISERKKAESAINEKNRELEEIFQTIPDALVKADRNRKILKVNPGFRKIFGFSEEDVLGKPTSVFYARRQDFDQQGNIRYNTNRPGKYEPYEILYRKKNGETFVGETVGVPVKDTSGNVLGFLGIIRDVTERKKAEEELREHQALVQKAQELAHLGSWELEVNSGVAKWSDEFFRICGYEPQAFQPTAEIGLKIIHKEDREQAKKALSRAIEENGHYEMEKRIVRPSGEVRWVLSQGAVHTEPDGSQKLTGSFLDITDRKKAENAMRASEERFRTYINQSPLVIIISDGEGYIIFANPSAERLLDCELKELKDKQIVEYHPSQSRQAALEKFQELKKSGFVHFESIIQQPGGRQLNVEIRATLLSSGYVMAFITDITDRMNLEEQLRQSQKLEAVGQLAGGVAHDFNNLLTVINGYSDLILSTMEKENPLFSRLNQIKKAGLRAESLTRQLLAFSRKQILKPEVVNMNQLIANMEKMLQRLIEENIQLVTLYDQELPPVMADPGQLEQVIMNLVVNARDAMPNGGKLTIETERAELDEHYSEQHQDVTPGEYVSVSVSDNGCGMKKAVLDRIFEPFYTTKEQGKGTGLGLSTVYGIVKQSGGNINVYSEPDKGTIFKIYLPSIPQENRTQDVKEEAEAIKGGSETIIVAEDEEAVRSFVEASLKQLGYRVLAFSDEQAMMEYIKKSNETVHLMLTDVVMPRMSGKDLAEYVKANSPDTKILFMSGYTGRSIVNQGMLLKGINFIQKPFTLQSLAAKVRQVLDA